MALRVGLNAQLLSLTSDYRNAGVGQYIYRLLQHLRPDLAGEELAVFLSPGVQRAVLPRRPGLRYYQDRFPSARPWLRVLWEQSLLPAWLVRRRIDVLHCPVNIVPILGVSKLLVTIHDLSFVKYPEGFPVAKQRYQYWLTRLSSKRAAMILADSASTRRDLVRLFGVDPGKVRVVYPGVTELYHQQSPHAIDTFRSRQGLDRPYILHVGTLQPRKNLNRLVEAFARFKRRKRTRHALVLVGGTGWMYDSLLRTVEAHSLRDDVRFVGYAAPDELPLWYAAAEQVAFPSLYEGFGFPVAEAMACGTPVISSNASCLPEVAGDAAILLSPFEVEEWAATMARLAASPDEREDLARRGQAQAARFTWDATATGVGAAYHALGTAA